MASIDGFSVQPADITFIGHELSRPECIIAERDGTLWVSDNRAAVTRIDPDGKQTLVGAIGGAPNGIAMDREGRLTIANIDDGKLYRVARDGTHEVILEHIDGQPLGAVNFVMFDLHGTCWFTVSTRVAPRSRALQEVIADGYVVRMDNGVPKCLARGFRFTNEVRIDAQERYAYVAETAIGAVSRLRIEASGQLGPAEPFGPRPLFPGARIDGITFDAEGNLWVTELSRNALVVLRPDGSMIEVFADPSGKVLDAPTSITFAGPDLRTVIVGSLRMKHMMTFVSPVPGAPLFHW